ncbi:hypothetical protein TRVA0_074S00386 [Trichomonascus vanleenenianus]|uniref:C2H2-type zinc finger protein n=1 Tax=Trichomonascus vanleenenianus TaxID=2268995 RepID=UPI003ECB545F
MGFKLVNNAGRSVNILNEDDDIKRRNSTTTHGYSQSLPSLTAPAPAPLLAQQALTTPPSANIQYGSYRYPYYPPYYTHQQQPQPQNPLPSLPPMTVGGLVGAAAAPPLGFTTAPATGASTPAKDGSPALSAKSAANNNKPRPAKKYTCHCMRSFTTSGHLARHMRIHTGEKNYVCPQEGCGARFSRQDNCMQHYRTHNGGRGRGANTNRARRKRNTTPPRNNSSSTASSSPATPQPYYSPQQQTSSVYQLPPIQYLSSPPPASPPGVQEEMQQPQGLPPPSVLATAPSSASQQKQSSAAADNNPLNVFAGVAIMQTVQ